MGGRQSLWVCDCVTGAAEDTRKGCGDCGSSGAYRPVDRSDHIRSVVAFPSVYIQFVPGAFLVGKRLVTASPGLPSADRQPPISSRAILRASAGESNSRTM